MPYFLSTDRIFLREDSSPLNPIVIANLDLDSKAIQIIEIYYDNTEFKILIDANLAITAEKALVRMISFNYRSRLFYYFLDITNEPENSHSNPVQDQAFGPTSL